MRRPSLLLLLLAAGLGQIGCPAKEDPNQCVGEPAIVPGVGVRTAEGQWCLGAPASAIDGVVGTADTSWDLGSVGRRSAYAGHHLAALYSSNEEPPRLTALYLHEGVAVQTAGGIGLGSTGAEVRAELGEPVIDPFLGHWWYRELGIAFELQQDRVTTIQLFRPVSPTQ